MTQPSASDSGGFNPISRGSSGNLDLLRSVAVILVVASHVPALTPLQATGLYHVGALGLLGVITFFVHTCLVLMMSLERQSASLGAERRAGTFFLRRAFRIYPLSIAVVLVTHVFPDAFEHEPLDLGTTVSNLLLVQNVSGHGSFPEPLWSLPYEVQMYLVLPPLYLLVARLGARAPKWLGAAWLASVCWVLVLFLAGANYHLVKYVPCFLPGVIAYALRGRRRALSPWFLFSFVAVAMVLLPVSVALGARENVAAWPICLALGLLIPRCRELKTPWVRRVSQTVAKYSYGVYLVHVPCMALIAATLDTLPGVVRWSVWLGAVVALSWLAYHGIERPGIEIGNRLAARWSAHGRAVVRSR